METYSNDIKTDIECWLETILNKDGLKNLRVNNFVYPEKGSGYIGDVIFVHASGTAANGSIKDYNFVLKCSKRSKILREESPVKDACLNEVFFYEQVAPAFKQFQLDKGIEDPFDNVAKCYGTFTDDDTEVIVLENLKDSGYELWDKKKPLLRKHVDMIIKKYGKFHATSVAMRAQQPEKFQKFVDFYKDVFKMFGKSGEFYTMFGTSVEEICDLFKDEFSEDVISKWRKLREGINYILTDMRDEVDGLKVILHGDCWSNNFMYQYSDDGSPLNVVMLDFQLSTISSPIFDLSYFIFTSTSKEDLDDLDAILKLYHESFSNHLKILGTDPNVFYPFNQLLSEWKKYSKFGIAMVSLVMKVCSTDKEEVVDTVEAVEATKNFGDTFIYEIKDKVSFKNRMRHIVKYVVDHGLI